jgi:hypothetical protein
MPKVPWDSLLTPKAPTPPITVTEDSMRQACERSMLRSRQLTDLDLVIAYLEKAGAVTEAALLERLKSEL